MLFDSNHLPDAHPASDAIHETRIATLAGMDLTQILLIVLVVLVLIATGLLVVLLLRRPEQGGEALERHVLRITQALPRNCL